ncbi:hypothetical protein KAFR_0E03790 [Kazachstania africana CBS 2517]|uniref:YTH domain-containing protein n=1 Tax=Kazachstania africana (strain ATCC 22294 / BCRC 22015 / CBS 2517 / CECT 1963 / NBRC 1671 / NRRL Y-8276) TaxID=1071382 RepID=H2AVY0_KAZAF|nr:hypothetical protein KAFR_0E03790 [Kazachstania africana CBS 2517]CCF58530.1 hypothetical protein KAFR_0E03790 [Kazachstania africana CBS 2517]
MEMGNESLTACRGGFIHGKAMSYNFYDTCKPASSNIWSFDSIVGTPLSSKTAYFDESTEGSILHNDIFDPFCDNTGDSSMMRTYCDGAPYVATSQDEDVSRAILPTWVDIPPQSLFFVIKSSSVDHIMKSFDNGIWSSTHYGNKRLSTAFSNLKDSKHGKIFLLFSVNGSGKFCGVAEMTSNLHKNVDTTNIWENSSKYGFAFQVNWIIVRNISNKFLKRFLIPNNEFKPITNSRDTQSIPFNIGTEIVKIFLNRSNRYDEISCFLDE